MRVFINKLYKSKTVYDGMVGFSVDSGVSMQLWMQNQNITCDNTSMTWHDMWHEILTAGPQHEQPPGEGQGDGHGRRHQGEQGGGHSHTHQVSFQSIGPLGRCFL